MKIAICIDSNAWNFLFNNKIDIASELPADEFKLFITREVEIELKAIPDIGKDDCNKLPLKKYIQESLALNDIKTTRVFGFGSAKSAAGPAIYGGFGQGGFQPDNERAWYQQDKVKQFVSNKSLKNSGLHGNQADAAVAAKAFNSVVLTCDKKRGPILEANAQGGKVIFLSTDLLANQSLGEIVRLKHAQ